MAAASAVLLSLAMGVLGLLAGPALVSAESYGTLKVQPDAQAVAGGTSFTVDVIAHAGVEIAQIQTDVVFDPNLLQIQHVKPGSAWAGATFSYANAMEAPAAVGAANQSGTLQGIQAAFLSGSSVPAGDSTFVTITFQALAGAGGTANIQFRNALMVGLGGGANLPVVVRPGVVTIAPAPGYTAGPSGGSPRPAPSACPPVGPSASAGVCASGTSVPRLYVAPDADKVEVGDTIGVTVLVNSDMPMSSIVLDFQFDQTTAQVLSVATTSDWPAATLSVREQVVKTLIDRANTISGVVQNIGVNIPAADTDLSVSGTFMTFTLKALKTGSLTVGVDNVQTVGTDGTQLDGVGSSVTITIGQVGGAAGSGGLDIDWLLLLAATILSLELLGCILLFVLPPETIKKGLFRRLPPWPYVVSLILGLIPVIAFASIVIVLVVNSLPAFTNPGIGPLLSTQFSGAYYGTGHGAWGLLPAIVGTIEIVLISLIVAFPVALALAVITTEFPMGPVGRIVRPLIGLMSGIPPIVYAVSMVIFVRVLMIPKFAGDQPGFSGFKPSLLGASSWPPSGVPWNPGSMPWDVLEANSSLLAGILVALLLIPFMTPMIADAIRDVPRSTREASLALGANRLYTLRKAVLPRAMPAIFTAVVLGALKAAGDVVIVTFAAGGEADNIPNPIFDIFEHAPSLPVQGANMIIPFKLIGASTPYDPESAAIGYLCALVLLALAAALVLEVNYLRARWRKRLAG